MAVNVIWMLVAHISITGWSAISSILLLGAVALLLAHSPLRHRAITEYVSYLCAWLIFTLAICLSSCLSATLAFPLTDATLAKFNASMGFNWVWWHNFLDHDISIFMYIQYAYNALLPLMLVSVFVLAIKIPGRNAELLWSAVIAGVITIGLFAVFPAMGASVYFGFGYHYDYINLLQELRAGQRVFDLRALVGIVSFPSFHGALAVMFAYAHRGLCTFYPVAIVCALLWLSSMTMGNHYLTDLIGGTIIAAFAIWSSHCLFRRGLTLATSVVSFSQ